MDEIKRFRKRQERERDAAKQGIDLSDVLKGDETEDDQDINNYGYKLQDLLSADEDEEKDGKSFEYKKKHRKH